ncbi:MAG: CopG family antitoxin, partial [Spirulinaceae cyanobacterium]
MSEVELNLEEKAILHDFEADEFKSTLNSQRKEQLAKAAGATFKKDKRINIRISSRDLEAIQRRALEEGIPYQTFVSSILHK